MAKSLVVTWSPESLKQIAKLKKAKSSLFKNQYFDRVILLIEDIKATPFKGLGKPEYLKHKIPPCWSRRINKKDRLVYRIKNNQIEIISVVGHYN